MNLCFVVCCNGDLGQFPSVFLVMGFGSFWILNSCIVELFEQESMISLNGSSI